MCKKSQMNFKLLIFTLFNANLFLNVFGTTTVKEYPRDPKIVGGSPITIQQAPWQVSVRLKVYDQEMYGYGHICGGSVISQRVVVTAAHCILNENVTPAVYRSPSEYTLVMGSAYMYVAAPYTLQYDVLQIAVNMNFNITTMVNDVAMFFINGYIPWNWPTVKAIPLNTIPEPNGTMCTISGWGKTSYNSDSVSSILMAVQVPIVSYSACDAGYGNIATGMICAGYITTGGADSCQGDSGGPMVCGGYLAGIVSWGYECALPGYPGIYTNVSYYDNWIVMNNQSFNYSLYVAAAVNLSLKRICLVLLSFVVIYLK